MQAGRYGEQAAQDGDQVCLSYAPSALATRPQTTQPTSNNQQQVSAPAQSPAPAQTPAPPSNRHQQAPAPGYTPPALGRFRPSRGPLCSSGPLEPGAADPLGSTWCPWTNFSPREPLTAPPHPGTPVLPALWDPLSAPGPVLPLGCPALPLRTPTPWCLRPFNIFSVPLDVPPGCLAVGMLVPVLDPSLDPAWSPALDSSASTGLRGKHWTAKCSCFCAGAPSVSSTPHPPLTSHQHPPQVSPTPTVADQRTSRRRVVCCVITKGKGTASTTMPGCVDVPMHNFYIQLMVHVTNYVVSAHTSPIAAYPPTVSLTRAMMRRWPTAVHVKNPPQ